MSALTLDQLLARMRAAFAEAGIGTAALDARMLLEAASGLDRSQLVLHGDRPASSEAIDRAADFQRRHLNGEPVGRIIGRREFYGLDLALGPDTLEPRPDTETLVDLVLDLVRKGAITGVDPQGAGLTFADIGTGSGAIALALVHELPKARGLACDIAPGALAVAEANARRLGLGDRLDFACGSYLDPLVLPQRLIVSNPPYIASAVVDQLAPEVRDHDPRLALDGGRDGLDAYRQIIAGAPARLVPGGWLAVEIGYDQAATVSALFAASGFADVAVRQDLGGLDRVVWGHLL